MALQTRKFPIPPPPDTPPWGVTQPGVPTPFLQSLTPPMAPAEVAPAAQAAPPLIPSDPGQISGAATPDVSQYVSRGQMPINLNAIPSIDPSYASSLHDSVLQQENAAQDAEQRYRDFQGYSLPESPGRSPTEDMLESAVKQRLTDLLSGKESRGARFERGFDMGQKIAGALVVPLIGAMSRGGMALGLAQAGQELRQQAAQASRERQAQINAQNQALLEMSNLYENLSPDSAKNMMALAKQRLQAMQMSTQEQNELLSTALTARHNATQARNEELKAMQGMTRDQWNALVQQHQAQVADANLQRETGNDLFNRGVKTQELGNQAERLGLEKEANLRGWAQQGLAAKASDLAQNKFDYQKTNDEAANNLKAQTQRLEALKILSGRNATLMRDLGQVDATGKPKYGDLLNRLLNNDAYNTETQALIDQAGLGGKIDAKGVLNTLAQQQQLQKSQNQTDVLGNIINSIGNGFKSLPGSPAAPPAPVIKPGAPGSITQAFVQKFGRPPKNITELQQFANGSGK